MNRYTKSFIVAALFYAGIFGTYFYSNKNSKTIKTEQIKSEQIVKFTVIQEEAAVKQTKKPIKKIVKKETPKKVIQKIDKPKKIATKKIKPVEKTIKKEKEKVTKKQVVKKIEEPKKIIKKGEKQIAKKQIKKNTTITKKSTNNLEDSKLKKQKLNQKEYYTKIKELINKNKSYPRIAIKRGIEGIVKVQFSISKYGELLSFNIVEGKKVFKKSISNAIQSSFPLRPPKGTLSSNTQLSLKINYRLY